MYLQSADLEQSDESDERIHHVTRRAGLSARCLQRKRDLL